MGKQRQPSWEASALLSFLGPPADLLAKTGRWFSEVIPLGRGSRALPKCLLCQSIAIFANIWDRNSAIWNDLQ